MSNQATELARSSRPTLPVYRDSTGRGYLFSGFGDLVSRSDDDGARGTWAEVGQAGGEVVAFGEVPPSDALPEGQLLAAVWNGVTYSDDGGETWTPSQGAYGAARFIGTSFAFLPEPGHPYGGAVLAGIDDLEWGRDSTATVYRSDDGGATWTRIHRFSPARYGLDNLNEVELVVTPDGVVWAGLSHSLGGLSQNRPGAIARSFDGGETWEPAQNGYGLHGVEQLALARDGRLYAATVVGVWRTTAPVYAVARESGAPAPLADGLGVTVWPNPAASVATVSLRLAGPERVRVAVLDALGREVAVIHDGPTQNGQRFEIETASLTAGRYLVRLEAASGASATAALTVVR